MCFTGPISRPALLSHSSLGPVPPQECHCSSAKSRSLSPLTEQPVPVVPASPPALKYLFILLALRFLLILVSYE